MPLLLIVEYLVRPGFLCGRIKVTQVNWKTLSILFFSLPLNGESSAIYLV